MLFVPTELAEGTRIRNHIAQLEARLAATGGDTTSNSEINRADVDPSHGHIDVENKCSTPPLDRLEMWTSMGTPPPEEVQDCHFDWEGYVNDGPDGDIGYDLHDMWMNATNDASPMTLEKDESAEAIMQLPSPAVEETGAEDGRPESPGESIIRTAHDGHHARGTGKPAVGMSHHCTGYDWGSISRKRQWPLSTSNPRRSSPVRSWSQDAVGLEPGSDAAAPRPCSSMPHDSAPSMPNPCCGPHGMHGRPMRDSTPAKPPPDASPSMRSSRRASSCSSTTGIDGPSYVPRLSVIGPGRHRRPSPSTDTSRKPPVGKVFVRMSMVEQFLC